MKKNSVVKKVPLDKLFLMTAQGFELEDVDGSLFVWCPLVRELIFTSNRNIANWLRKEWRKNKQLGMNYDCILINQDGKLNLFYEDESTVIASYKLNEEERNELEQVSFIYIRSFNRKEVQICLPEER